MRNFILDKKPSMNEANVTLDGVRYNLRMVQNNGCYISIFEHDIIRDEIALTKKDMMAIYLLLTTK